MKGNRSQRRLASLVAALAVLLVVSACSGGDNLQDWGVLAASMSILK
jgi:hypothetical protein